QKGQSIADRKNSSRDPSRLQRNSDFGAAAQLKNRHVLIRVHAEILQRRTEIKMNARTQTRNRGRFSPELLGGLDVGPADQIDEIGTQRTREDHNTAPSTPPRDD